MAVIDGGEFRVKVSGVVIGYATSSTINLSTQLDKIAATGVSAAAWDNYTPGRRSATINTNALYGTSTNKNFADLWNAWVNGNSVSIEFGSPGAGEWKFAGTAYIKSLSATGAVAQDSTARASFQFSGPVALSTNSSEPETILTDDSGTGITDDSGVSLL